jgi:hypothetical protein
VHPHIFIICNISWFFFFLVYQELNSGPHSVGKCTIIPPLIGFRYFSGQVLCFCTALASNCQSSYLWLPLHLRLQNRGTTSGLFTEVGSCLFLPRFALDYYLPNLCLWTRSRSAWSCDLFFFFTVLGLELMAFTLNHSTSLIFFVSVKGFSR